jgi:hypothetical protein
MFETFPEKPCSKSNEPNELNSDQTNKNLNFLKLKTRFRCNYLTNNFKFICLENNASAKSVFIGFMFVFLQLSAHVSGQLHQGFACKMKSAARKQL